MTSDGRCTTEIRDSRGQAKSTVVIKLSEETEHSLTQFDWFYFLQIVKNSDTKISKKYDFMEEYLKIQRSANMCFIRNQDHKEMCHYPLVM